LEVFGEICVYRLSDGSAILARRSLAAAPKVPFKGRNIVVADGESNRRNR
jgi:hypothetical protein